MQSDFESNLTKRVSFVLTTKNRGPYLKKALKNTKELIGTDDELIIIDGNSTDETQDIIRENSDYIDIFISEDDEGQGHAYNKGLLLSKGKYVCYITDVDIYYSKAVEQAVEIMEKHPGIDVLIPGGMKEKNGKKEIATYHAMTMELLGENLYTLKEAGEKNKFSLITVLMLAD